MISQNAKFSRNIHIVLAQKPLYSIWCQVPKLAKTDQALTMPSLPHGVMNVFDNIMPRVLIFGHKLVLYTPSKILK